MNHNTNSTTKKRKSNKGVDTLLTIRGKKLAAGESVRVRLVKGPSVQASGDPVDSKAPISYFPMLAKFPESVQKPDFTREPWKSARFYEQDVPKPIDDSDDEEAAESAQQQQQSKKKRWRYGDGQAPRQWVLQENVDFLQTMVDRKEQTKQSSSDQQTTLSSRYEGTSEHNPSQYALFRLHPDTTTSPHDAAIQVVLMPAPQDTNATVLFAQPAARKTYSLTEAEHVISDQRMGLVKTLHHMHKDTASNSTTSPNNNGNGDGTDPNNHNNTNDQDAAPRPNILALRKKAAQSSKGRLLSKLQQKSKSANADEEEGDDIMGDVAFRNRKGGGAARKELLSTVADSVLVSDEGVLGGANDGMFGGKQRFAQFTDAAGEKSEKEEGGEDGADAPTGGQDKERGADGAAMEDDFYQRDVKAEYDELDYDANEQFDDDDVDLGEAEQVIETSGFGDDDIDDEMDDDEMDDDAQDGGAEGLASLAGFKALLAKARGEMPMETEAATAQSRGDDRRKKETVDHMSKIMMAAEKSRLEAERKAPKSRGGAQKAHIQKADTEMEEAKTDATNQPSAAPRQAAVEKASMVDATGQRIISLDSVKREIWLNHGSIPMKRLMKIFVINKKASPERQAQFRDAVKELCSMKNDPVHGRMLVLKQHYSKG